jgi:predicted transcriptional regulator
MGMTIELPASIEKELHNLAVQQHRQVGDLVEEAVRHYIEAVAITDLDAEDIVRAQAALASELRIDEWKAEPE